MTLDLPSTKLKEDQKWVDNIFQLVNKGKQKQAKIVKSQLKKRTPNKHELLSLDSDKERLHDGVVSVSEDTRTLADRLHEKLETLKGERGSGKKRKADEDDELNKYVSVEKMNTSKKKKKGKGEQQQQQKDKNEKNENKEKEQKDKKENGKKQKREIEDDTTVGGGKYEKHGKGKKAKPTFYDEDGIEYPGDFYSDDEGDISLFDDNEIPDKVKNSNNNKKNKNKNNAPQPQQSLSPEEEENLQFGTFDFSSGKPVPMYLSNKSPKRKNLPRMLKKAEKLQLRLQDESEQGQVKADQYKWDRMMKKAQGTKVRDNPILISKKMASIKKKKKQSAIKWEARNAQVEKDKDIRFQRRQANIKAKMERKKTASLRRTIGASKLKTPPKRKGGKGHKRPGFEGKKGSSFINK